MVWPESCCARPLRGRQPCRCQCHISRVYARTTLPGLLAVSCRVGERRRRHRSSLLLHKMDGAFDVWTGLCLGLALFCFLVRRHTGLLFWQRVSFRDCIKFVATGSYYNVVYRVKSEIDKELHTREKYITVQDGR